ncbi:hypothetical protein ACQCP7_26015, partial [Ralstonia pseudosolanacearum]|uniref:hypothetical protein n=1 Tax=Ralstonia pseudosolanacearum TaxID=1310165 RepID=UPI003CF96CA3
NMEKKLPKKSKKTARTKTKETKVVKKTKVAKENFWAKHRAKRKAKKEAAARRRAEDLATLPKEPVKRFFARLHPKRVFKWWFSWRGQMTILKVIGIFIILCIIGIGGLFLYYKKDLDEIRLDEMTI